MNTFLRAVNSGYRSHKGMLSCEFIFDLHSKGFANKQSAQALYCFNRKLRFNHPTNGLLNCGQSALFKLLTYARNAQILFTTTASITLVSIS